MYKIIQLNLPWWTPSIIGGIYKEKYLGLELKKPYWIFLYAKGNSFMRTIHGLN